MNDDDERDARMETLTDAIADAHRSIAALDDRMIVMVDSVTTLTELFDRHLRRDHGYGEPDDN